jgi:hypothetical protein
MNSRSRKNVNATTSDAGGDAAAAAAGAEALGLEHERLLDPEEGQMAPDEYDEAPEVILVPTYLAELLERDYGWTFPKKLGI